MRTISVQATQDVLMDISNFLNGVFHPLTGFMKSKDYLSCLEEMHLSTGPAWTIPITFDLRHDQVQEAKNAGQIVFYRENLRIASLDIEDVYEVNYVRDLKKVYGTDSLDHPGVKKETSRSPWRVGGTLHFDVNALPSFTDINLSPSKTKQIFSERGWKTITGFQTRNAPHLAHEYLQRVALEVTDGLMVQPLVGWKKTNDFTADAVIGGYQALIKNYYSKNRVLLNTLETNMRYAGPREAVFHAIIRRNYGCTHFIVGRDHAGVGNFYGKYDAQKLANSFSDLGIKILDLAGPYYCKKCESIATERSCGHGTEHIDEISGTDVRKLFEQNKAPPDHYMRREVSQKLLELQLNGNLFY